MTELQEILNITTEKYKKKTYSELEKILTEVQCFNEKHKRKEYNFEIQVIKGKNQELKVMVQCSRNLFFISMFSKHRYFSITPEGEVNNLDGGEYWS